MELRGPVGSYFNTPPSGLSHTAMETLSKRVSVRETRGRWEGRRGVERGEAGRVCEAYAGEREGGMK